MTKFYYIEGPDGAGKTTLINSLKKDNDMFYHNGVYASMEDAFNTYHEQLNCYEQNKTTTFGDFNCFMDRGPIAEVNYGIIMRSTVVPTEMYWELLQRFKNMSELELILCLPPYEVAKKNWSSRLSNEYIQDTKKFKAVYDMYENLLHRTFFDIDITHYDYTKGMHNDVISK